MSDVNLRAVESFLYREAGLLDSADLDAWMQLYTEDGTYWMPAMRDQPDPLNYISHMYDDRVTMEIRRRNFVHPRASSKDSIPRSLHLIGNVHVKGRTDDDDLIIGSNFQVSTWYRDELKPFAGTYTHHLQCVKDSFLIRHKKVELINPEAPQTSMVIYL